MFLDIYIIIILRQCLTSEFRKRQLSQDLPFLYTSGVVYNDDSLHTLWKIKLPNQISNSYSLNSRDSSDSLSIVSDI